MRQDCCSIHYRNRLIIIGILIYTTLLFLITCKFLHITFQTNDDVFMLATVAGKWLTSQPSEFLLFQNVLIGLLLKNLYISFPDISWYSLYLVSTLFVCFFILLYVISKNINKKFLLHFISLSTVFFIYFLLSLQFTIVASVVAITGWVLLFSNFFYSNKVKVIIFLLFLLSSLIRYQVFILFVLINFFVFLTYSWLTKKKLIITFKKSILIFVSILFAIGFNLFNHHYYQIHEGWNNFYEFNKLQAMINDCFIPQNFPDQIDPALADSGMSRIDYHLFLNWYFPNKDIFSIQKLNTFLSHFPKYNRNIKLEQIVNAIRDCNRPVIIIMVICALFPFLIVQKSPGSYITSVFVVILSLIIFIIIIIIFFKAPPLRIVIPLIANIFFLVFILTDLSDKCVASSSKSLSLYGKNYMSKSSYLVSLLIISAILMYSGKNILAKSSLNHSQNIAFEDLITTLKTKPQLTCFSWADGFPFEWMDPFQNMNFFNDFHIIVLGDSVRTPIIKAMIDKTGIDNIDLLILKNNSYLFVRGNLNERAYLLCNYIKNHYGIQTRTILLKEFGTTYNIVAFRPKTDADYLKFKSLSLR